MCVDLGMADWCLDRDYVTNMSPLELTLRQFQPDSCPCLPISLRQCYCVEYQIPALAVRYHRQITHYNELLSSLQTPSSINIKIYHNFSCRPLLDLVHIPNIKLIKTKITITNCYNLAQLIWGVSHPF